jgi:hypothetical protein
MKEDRKTNNNANADIDPLAFIRQVSVAGSNAETAQSTQVAMQTDMESDLPEPIEAQTKEPIKRKRGQVDYESLFLIRNEIRTRQGLYIDRENYEILQTLIRAIRSERLSVSGLVDNIVRHHIELYGDEINRIYEENSRKPIKKKQ